MIRKKRSASFLDAPLPRQATERELGDKRTSGNGREQRDRKAPKITVKSAPGKPLNVDMQPIDSVRLMSAFGTAEPGFATLMLSGIINAACDGGQSHPPGSGDINDARNGEFGWRADAPRCQLMVPCVTHLRRLGGVRSSRCKPSAELGYPDILRRCWVRR